MGCILSARSERKALEKQKEYETLLLGERDDDSFEIEPDKNDDISELKLRT